MKSDWELEFEREIAEQIDGRVYPSVLSLQSALDEVRQLRKSRDKWKQTAHAIADDDGSDPDAPSISERLQEAGRV